MFGRRCRMEKEALRLKRTKLEIEEIDNLIRGVEKEKRGRKLGREGEEASVSP